MSTVTTYDVLVIGSGPAGQKAAIMAAKCGKRVAVIEREPGVGGACVYRGTIPSKTLREAALSLERVKRGAAVFDCKLREGVEVGMLMQRLEEVVSAHGRYMGDQLRRNGIAVLHGCSRFLSSHRLALTTVAGLTHELDAELIVLATGSRPRHPANIPVDHEHILDSDSILSMIYLPRSLAIVGAGVVGCEYASIFSLLGVSVTIIDAAPRPLQFIDAELTERFLASFEGYGGRYCGRQRVKTVRWDGVLSVVATLENGEEIVAEKMLVASGRQPNLEDLNLGAAGLETNGKGYVSVNQHCQTPVPHIYAVGDMAGPPSLASSAMEQGRRAMCHALGMAVSAADHLIPMGIYTIPELSCVGLDESRARERYGNIVVGRADFSEVARGQIAGSGQGLLKMIAGPDGHRLLGVQIIGENATELIHLGELALINGNSVETFVEGIFNFPTYAEAYRIAALDIVKQRGQRPVLAKAG
ncbi:MAG: Si-specific NAD(P)(+) transhydrogenase [Nitrospiraceae bacterium]